MSSKGTDKRRPSRQASGEGTIYERNGRFYGSVQMDGDRRWLSGKDRKSVVQQIAELRQQGERGALPPREAVTVQQFCERWVADVIVPGRRENTARNYEQQLRVNVYPTLGRVKLRELRPMHLTKLYSDLLARGL